MTAPQRLTSTPGGAVRNGGGVKAARVLLAALFIASAALLISSCGGGGGVNTPPPPAPTASLAPSSLSFGNQNVGSTSGPQAVTLTNTGTVALTISGISVTGANKSDFSETNACGTSLAAGKSCAIAVAFAPTAAGARSASLAVADNASGDPQTSGLSGTGIVTLGISPATATVLLGATQTLTLTGPATCTSPLFGNLPVTGSNSTGYTAAYAVPEALPSAWTDTPTCTSTLNSSVTASAQVTLRYPVPVITGTSASGVSLGTYFTLGPSGSSFLVNGTGFLSGLNFTPLNDAQDTCGATLLSWSQLQVSLALGYTDFGVSCPPGTTPSTWDPGFLEFTLSYPDTGHGGGTSNVGRLAFLGNQNLLAFNNTDVFLLDPGNSTVRKFKLTDGSPDGSFTFTPGTGLAIGIDDTTGDLVLFTGTSFQVFNPITNANLYELDAASPGSLQGGAVGNGWAVFSAYDGTEGIPAALDAIDLQHLGGGPVHSSVKDLPQNGPWNFQMTSLGGNPTEVVWSIVNGVLSSVDPSSLNVINSIIVPNIFTTTIMDNTPTPTAALAGWQLQVFNTGPLAGTAVILSQYDQVLVYVNLATMTEIRRVDLTQPFKNANPPLPVLQSFRIGKDEADGSVVVAFADPVNGKTVLYNVDQNGNMSPLGATEPFLATGLQESADGTQIYWGNRSSFAITPKQ